MGQIQGKFKINDELVDLVVDYDYIPGRPATGPAYAHGGLPPEPSEISFTKVTVCGTELLDREEALSQKTLEEIWEAIEEHELNENGPSHD